MIVWLKVYSDMAMWSTEVLLSSLLAIFALDPLNGRGITNWSVDGFQDSLSHIKISLFYDLFGMFFCGFLCFFCWQIGLLATAGVSAGASG